MTEKRFFKNTAILFVSMTITKIVGALFKIPLANLLGGTGMGYFSSAYGLYSPVFALTAAGIPTVMMRTAARCAASGDMNRCAAARRCALIMFSIVGALGSALILLLSKPFAVLIAGSPESAAAIKFISPAVFICCIAGVLRGVREGLADVRPSAAAAVAEAVSRAVFGLALSYAAIIYAKNEFLCGREVFGTSCATMEQACAAALPYAAAGAVAAVSISELFGLITLIIAEKKTSLKLVLPPRREYSARRICGELIREIIPVAASSLILNAVSLVDLLTVTRSISYSISNCPEYYLSNFGDILESCGGLSALPNFMYGSYTGIAMSLFMLIPSFAGMAGTAAAPETAAAYEKKDFRELSKKIRLHLKVSTAIACPACLGAFALAEPILNLLYRSRAAEVAASVNSFKILCLGGFFMTLSSALFVIFQSVGKSHIPLILMTVSVSIKAILNPILISIPALNISGAALASVAGYIFMTAGGLFALKKIFPQKIGIKSPIFLNIVNGVSCAAAAKTVYECIKSQTESPVCVVISVLSGVVICAILLFIENAFSANGIIKAKIPKKMKKRLEK